MKSSELLLEGLPLESAVEAVEVWNSRHDGKVALRSGILKYWLKLRAGTGRQLLPLCGIDFHDKRDFVPLVMEVECAGRDRDSILAGIREGTYRIALGERIDLIRRVRDLGVIGVLVLVPAGLLVLPLSLIHISEPTRPY